MRGLRNWIVEPYEASAIVPGRVLPRARSAPRRRTRCDQRADRDANAPGMGPHRCAHRRAGREANPEWRLVRLSVGSSSERLIGDLRRGQSSRSGRSTSASKEAISDDALREMAPLWASTWLLDVLPKALGLLRPTIHNSDGDEVVFHEVQFPFVPTAMSEAITDRLEAISGLHRENETFWNWLAEPGSTRPPKRRDDAEKALGWNVTMEDGSTVLGNVEIKERSLVVSVNSAARAERAIAMLRPVLGALVAPPLTQIQTIDKMLAQQQDRPRPASDIPVEIQIRLVHQVSRPAIPRPARPARPDAWRCDAAPRGTDRRRTREAGRLAEASGEPLPAAARPG